MFICDMMMEATKDGRSRNIFLVVCCHYDYHIYHVYQLLLSLNLSKYTLYCRKFNIL